MFLKRGFLPMSRGYVNEHGHYSQTSCLKPLGQSKPNFMWNLLERGGKYKNGLSHMTKMAGMPIIWSEPI